MKGEHKNPRRLISATPRAFAEFDRAWKAARCRSFSAWARSVLSLEATRVLEDAATPIADRWDRAIARVSRPPAFVPRAGKVISTPPASSSVVHLVDGLARVACGARNWEFDSTERKHITCKNCKHAAGISTPAQAAAPARRRRVRRALRRIGR